jgi:hypothetical protein
MHGAILSLFQYAFVVWYSVLKKEQEQLSLYLYHSAYVRSGLYAVEKRKIPSPHRESNPRIPIVQHLPHLYIFV